MQNRFTAKDFFYMLIGLTACLLLFLNMLKTDREVVSLENIGAVLKSQSTTLGKLEAAITELGGGLRVDPGAVMAPTPDHPGSSRSDVAENIASRPSYEPGYDIRFGAMSTAVNRRGLRQQWQTAPDAELPEDFATGDTLVLSWSSDSDTITPIVATDAYSRRIFWEVLEYLVNQDIDAPFGFAPGLARSWEVSDDGMEITFHLFENATWSDGRPVTADDVVFTWDLAFNPKIDAAHHRGYLEPNVDGYEALNKHTVRFRMKQPYFDAVKICGNQLFIIPRHVYGDYDEPTFNRDISDLVVGSGPWLLDSWSRGQQIVLVRNENYWGPKPALEKQIIRIVSNELANMQEFRAGNIDYMRRPSPQQWVQTVDASWFRERGAQAIRYYTPLAGYQYLGYNLRRPYFADKRTRQALTMLLDRTAIIDTLRHGMGAPITGPFYFKADQYDASIEPWPYDPDRARRLLAEVGWRDTDGDGVLDMDLDGDGTREPFEFTFRVPSGLSFYDRLQRFVQNAFKSAGIKVNLDQIEWSVFLERLNERQYDMVSLIWTGTPESDPYQIWHSTQEANRGSNHIGFNNPEADRLIEAGRRTVDYDDRMRIWHEFHALLHEEQPYTFLFAKPEQIFLHERFRNVLKHDYKLWQSEWYVPARAQLR